SRTGGRADVQPTLTAADASARIGIAASLECADDQDRAAVRPLTLFARRAMRRETVLGLMRPLLAALLRAACASRNDVLAPSTFFSSTAVRTFFVTPFTALSADRLRWLRTSACRARLIVDL